MTRPRATRRFCAPRWFARRIHASNPAGSRIAPDGEAGFGPRRRTLACLLAGAALPLAFAPFGLYPVAVLAPAVLFALWASDGPRRAFLHGWVFGLGMFGAGISWVHESFRFSEVDPLVAAILTAALVASMALYPAVLGLLVTLRVWRGTILRPGAAAWCLLLVPAGWVLWEWVRGWLLTGFTWLQLGYSQPDSPLAGLAPVFGVYGVGWAAALSAGAVVALRNARRVWVVSVSVLAVVWIGGGLLRNVSWTAVDGMPIQVALVQGNVPQDQKWLPQQRGPTLERYMSLTRRHWDADVVVWPETALPGMFRNMEPFVAALAREARRHDTDVLLGVPMSARSGAVLLNSMLALTGDGAVFYHKRHLVPFGEYLPLDGLLRPVVDHLGIHVSNFSPGPSHQRLPVLAGQRVGLSICYEVAFGEEIIRALPEAGLLVNASNDAWFGRSIGPHQHLEIARMRALETGRYLLRATNTGISAVIDPRGTILVRSRQFEADVIAATVTGMAGPTPYVRHGNAGVLIPVAILILAGMAAARRRRSIERAR